MSVAQGQVKSDQQLPLDVNIRFSGSQEEIGHRYSPAAVQIGDLGLRLEYHQGDGAIRGREGMDNVASQGGGVAYLRTGHQLGGFEQCLSMLLDQVRGDQV